MVTPASWTRDSRLCTIRWDIQQGLQQVTGLLQPRLNLLRVDSSQGLPGAAFMGGALGEGLRAMEVLQRVAELAMGLQGSQRSHARHHVPAPYDPAQHAWVDNTGLLCLEEPGWTGCTGGQLCRDGLPSAAHKHGMRMLWLLKRAGHKACQLVLEPGLAPNQPCCMDEPPNAAHDGARAPDVSRGEGQAAHFCSRGGSPCSSLRAFTRCWRRLST